VWDPAADVHFDAHEMLRVKSINEPSAEEPLPCSDSDMFYEVIFVIIGSSSDVKSNGGTGWLRYTPTGIQRNSVV